MEEIDANAPRLRILNWTFAWGIERQRVLAIAVALFFFTFLAYYLTGPDFDLLGVDVQNEGTPYAHQVNQANNLIHGHLDFVPEYTKNFNTLERVMYDGEGFCFKPGDPEAAKVTGARISPDCKTFMQHSLGPALMVIPGVLIWGNNLNQILVSIIFGAMTAPVVFLIARYFSTKLTNQLVLTALMMFGTIFWWVASNGGVWFFAHRDLLHVLRHLLHRRKAESVPGWTFPRGRLPLPADDDTHRALLRGHVLAAVAQAP